MLLVSTCFDLSACCHAQHATPILHLLCTDACTATHLWILDEMQSCRPPQSFDVVKVVRLLLASAHLVLDFACLAARCLAHD